MQTAAPSPELRPFRTLQADLDAGLGRTHDLVPVGHGYVEATAGLNRAGAFGRVEAGYHPIEPLSLFGFGQVDTQSGPGAGVGARWTF